ncbi:MAG: hydrogenase maturation nickel metallochaperone HypA [Firmicutes bacterium]|nr:hydrogenase maturation nickel metallochaperone HypA [Bacillota bacterium]
MPPAKFKCDNCLKDFVVKYILIKPGKATCPHCSSPGTRENNNPGRECNSKGFRFT